MLHSDIDEAILYIGKVVAREFSTKPLEKALEATRMARKQLTQLEEYKLKHEAKMRELTFFPRYPILADGSSIEWPFLLPAPPEWNQATDEQREKMIAEYGLDDPILDPDKTFEEDVDEALREVGIDPEKVRN